MRADTVGVIVAGGAARRMGGVEKGFLDVGGRTIFERTVECLQGQLERVALNANGDPTRFARLEVPVLADAVAGGLGPLAGVLAGLDWAASLGVDWLVTVPGDCPFLPTDLIERLHAGRGAEGFACAASGARVHPVAALWPVDCRAMLRHALLGGLRRVGGFAEAGRGVVEWGVEGRDPFFNINTKEELEKARGAALTQP